MYELTTASVACYCHEVFFLSLKKQHSQCLCDNDHGLPSQGRGTSCPDIIHSVLLARTHSQRQRHRLTQGLRGWLAVRRMLWKLLAGPESGSSVGGDITPKACRMTVIKVV